MQVLTVVLYVLGALALYILVQWLVMRFKYKPIFDWWSRNDGAPYDQFLNLTYIYAHYTSWFLYPVTILLDTTPSSVLGMPAIRFIIMRLLRFIYQMGDDGTSTGVLLPIHLGKSVMLNKGQGMPDFDIWYDRNGRDQDPWSDTHQTGLYPASNTDYPMWKLKIATWAGYSGTKDDLLKFWVTDPKTGMSAPDPTTVVAWTKAWNDSGPDSSNFDNFLSRMGIMPDSPLIVNFVSNQWVGPHGEPLDFMAFGNLLGSGTGAEAGGWLGFIRNMESANVSSDSYTNFLYTKYTPNPPPPDNNCGGGWRGTAGNLASSISAAAGIGGLAMMTSAPEAGAVALGMGPAGWALLGVGALVGLFDFFSKSSTSNTCAAASDDSQ